ncbi:MAG: protein SdhA [Legionellales bacterium]
MFEKQIKRLETLQKYQASKLIAQLSAKIMSTLNGAEISHRIAPYVTGLSSQGEPFTDFTQDPEPIFQIKTIMNALYHLRLSLLDIEHIDIKNPHKIIYALQSLVSRTLEHGYKACFLLTHLSLDLRAHFATELALILPLLQQVNGVTASYSAITAVLKTQPLSYKAGIVSGIAVDRLEPNNNNIGSNVLIQFNNKLSACIDQFTQDVKKYSSQFLDTEPQLNREKLEKIRDTALGLLDNLRRSSVSIPSNYLNYMQITYQIISLSTSSLTPLGDLSESSQDVIRNQLAQLKYTVLPTLFALVDGIENNALLQPGLLSRPLMKKTKQLYQLLIQNASRLVDFNTKGAALLSIEDASFLRLRLQPAYKRMDKANQELFKIKQIETALVNFYALLDQPEHQDVAIHRLSKETRAALISHYKIIKPYMEQVDIDFTRILTASLQGHEPSSSIPAQAWRLLSSYLPVANGQPDHVCHLQTRKKSLYLLLSKNRNTQNFHLQLAADLIDTIQKHSHLVLSPYNEASNIFIVDESNAQKSAAFIEHEGDVLHATPSTLSSEQALALYQSYDNKYQALQLAKEAYQQFLQLTQGTTEHLLDLDETIKAQCRGLYIVFQAYFINAVSDKHQACALNCDQYLTQVLSGKLISATQPKPYEFKELNRQVQSHLTKVALKWRIRAQDCLERSVKKYAQEQQALALSENIQLESRAHCVLKHSHGTRYINEFRSALQQMTAKLNQSMRRELDVKSSPKPVLKPLKPYGFILQSLGLLNHCFDLPYPELEHSTESLAQGKQVLALKRMFNALYYIESIAYLLEQLNEQDSKAYYMLLLWSVYDRAETINSCAQDLLDDPYYQIIARDLFNKAQSMLAALQEQSTMYQPSQPELLNKEAYEMQALAHVLNAFYIIPKHINALQSKHYIHADKLTDLQVSAKKTTLQIKAIINSIQAPYFSLFLQIPNMYFLYKELQSKLNELTSVTHAALFNKLEQLQSTVFTAMLLEADLSEDNMGLSPGSLSGPLKRMVDAYYKGLLEPLGLDSKTHIAFVGSKYPLQTRRETVLNRHDSAKKRLDERQEKYQPIAFLYQLLMDYQQLATNELLAPDSLVARAKDQSQAALATAFKKALPTLVELQTLLALDPDTKDELNLDAFLNATTKNDEPKLTGIKNLVTTSHHYYLGLQATDQMTLKTAHEKLTYLSELSGLEAQQQQLFIEQYTTTSFNNQVATLSKQTTSLQFTHQEFTKQLTAYLQLFATQITAQAAAAEDINACINDRLQRKIKDFANNHSADFVRMDAVRAALDQFQCYANKTTTDIKNNRALFENSYTLKIKSEYINKLQQIAANEQLTFAERFIQLKSSVNDANFKTVLLAYNQVNYFSFTRLQQWLLSLLEALNLYTPARKTVFNSIHTAVNNAPKNSAVDTGLGFFSAPSILDFGQKHMQQDACAVTPIVPAQKEVLTPYTAPVF